MSEFNIEVQGGSSVRLPTAGKYCEKDIIVTASGGGGTEEIENLIDQSGVLDSTEGTATVKVEKLIEKAEDENAWYQYTSTLTDIKRWTNATCETLPRMDLSKVTSLSYSFSQMPNLKRIDFRINSESCTNFNSSFLSCKQLEYVKGIDLSRATFVNACFASCTALKTIEEPIDCSYLSVNSTESGIHMFYNATALETIRIVPESIKKHFILANTSVLTAESVQSIIDGLAYVDSTQNLTLSNRIVLTDNQKQVINAKGWTLIQ